MAASKISNLTAVTTAVVTDEFAVAQDGSTLKMTLAQVRGDAYDLPFSAPTGSITADNVGDAIREIEDDLEALDADSLPFTSNTGGVIATNTGDAIRELQDEILDLDATQIAFASSTGDLNATTVEEAIREVEDESQKIGEPVALPPYTVAGLPAAGDFTNAMIMVSDETGGSIPAFSDGTNWRRVTDRAIVS